MILAMESLPSCVRMANSLIRNTGHMQELYRHFGNTRSSCQYLALTCFAALVLPACSRTEAEESDLEVVRIPKSELQATAFVQLNEDKPGTPVDAREYLVPGKHTIVGYLSAYDDKSLNIEPRLLKLTEMRQDIAVRIVDINRPEVKSIDWESPTIQDLNIQSLPYFEIYDPAQALRAHGRPAYEQISQWLQPIP